MTDDNITEPVKPSDTERLKHLDFIQALITRMSHSSVQAKSWLLPVVVAAYGYALTQRSGSVALLGIAAVFLFGYMDASYLRQERAYRRLYNAVVEGKKQIPLFSLDPHDADKSVPDADGDPASSEKGKSGDKTKSYWKEACEAIRGWFFLDPKVLFSWSIFPFYFGFLFVGGLVLWYAATH
jgi:histidine triad (HIT) family protein